MTNDDLVTVQRAIEEQLPQPWTQWPGGYPHEVEAALLDAVLSIRARYGSASTGVRGAVARYRDEFGDGNLDHLPRLAEFDPLRLSAVLQNKQQASGRLKTEAIVEAARNLVATGVRTASDVDPDEHKRAYTKVPGLGAVTWEYFTMLLGRPGVKADTWVTRWVSAQLRRDVTSADARALLHEAAMGLADTQAESSHAFLTRLDHQIWRTARLAGRRGGTA